jgi:hypothetical protein
MSAGEVTVFGIRHHGPGSARSLLRALDELRPDAILLEGPPDAEPVLPLAASPEMRPPVALLLYARDDPRRAVYYPFAEFSPEWQALRCGLAQGIPVRFMDLPQSHQLLPEALAGTSASPDPSDPSDPSDSTDASEQAAPDVEVRRDPLGWLAEAAGYSDGERWWDHMVESRRDGTDLFAAILEAMTALRAEVPPRLDPEEARREALREAWMRQTIRAARREGFARIAVVCGAWHAPVLAEMPPAAEDVALLKGLPKVPVEATWTPWTYGRLAYESGYGAGIESPGWYEHLWHHPERPAPHWLTRVARLLRDEDLDASSAHVIEAVRLAETLAAVRDRPLPGLPELSEATQSVFCFGSDLPLALIRERLIVGERLGEVPAETPSVPLQQDLQREQKRLRLPVEASFRDLDLDLRKPNDLERSHLLHRLALLDVPWGIPQQAGGGKGTFHENWRVQWQPEFVVRLIEAAPWGNTVLDAATARARDTAQKAADLPSLTRLLDQALLADLADAVPSIMQRLESEAAVATDVGHLMDALPPLANVLRYGNVRRTDSSAVAHVVDGLVARICIGLPNAAVALDDEAAEAMYGRLLETNAAVVLLSEPEQLASWRGVLARLLDQRGVHGLLAGRCCRLLLEARAIDAGETARRLGLALSTAEEPPQAAAWVEGLLRGCGLVLVHDESLWGVLDGWLADLKPETFTQLLPLLRRTFATFPAPERRSLGERARTGAAHPSGPSTAAAEFDEARAQQVLLVLARLLGAALPNDSTTETQSVTERTR